MRLPNEQYEIIRRWMYRNARPLDIARWRFHFENGSRLDVLTALSAYQNKDGGFGNALEADSWNPNSSPLQTWCATEVLNEIGITYKNNTIVRGILSYLESQKDYLDGHWLAEIPSNNNYPHAPWWTYNQNGIEEWGYNPTICLVGFILFFTDKQSELYQMAAKIARKAVKDYLEGKTTNDMHEEYCFLRFYDYCMKAGITDIFDVPEMRNRIIQNVSNIITKDTKEWSTGYICKPSRFNISPRSIFYQDNKEIAHYETEFIIKNMNEDGTWNVNWNWSDYQEEWVISKNWWKAQIIIENMIYLKGFDCLE
jgi:hypothetical protein